MLKLEDLLQGIDKLLSPIHENVFHAGQKIQAYFLSVITSLYSKESKDSKSVAFEDSTSFLSENFFRSERLCYSKFPKDMLFRDSKGFNMK
jgi:hypothetical protein